MSTAIATPPLVQSAPLCLDTFGLSHPGLERMTNQDAYLIAEDACLVAVADGVGGGPAGEMASRLALETIRAEVGDRRPSGPQAVPFLSTAVRSANARVRDAAHEDLGRAGMATTLTALLLHRERAALVHVGDSRAYRLRGGRLERLTTDHTIVQACIQAGLMTRAEATKSEMRHVITRALGAEPGVDVDAPLVRVLPGDLFLLSTDGLHGVTSDDEIAEILLSDDDLSILAEELLQSALDRGGPDNVTVVLARAA